jgi:hypothetical protein
MKSIAIYLRSIEKDGIKHLSMFDTNRNHDINNLITTVPQGATVIWTQDSNSGIKSITKIYSKTGKRNVFRTDPAKKLLSSGLQLTIADDAEGEEAYAIDYILEDGTQHTIDPVIRIEPPK